jgi:hypothetical protein
MHLTTGCGGVGATTDVPLRRYVVVPDESVFLTLAPKPLYANAFVAIPGLVIELTRSS